MISIRCYRKDDYVVKKLTVFGVIFSIIILSIYVGETYDLIKLVANTTSSSLDNFFGSLFTTYPWWWLLCSFGSVICGVLAPILYFFKSTYSIECAYSAFGLDMLLFVLNLLFRQRLSFTSVHMFVINVIIALLTIGFAGYLSSRKENTYHSSKTGWRFLGS